MKNICCERTKQPLSRLQIIHRQFIKIKIETKGGVILIHFSIISNQPLREMGRCKHHMVCIASIF